MNTNPFRQSPKVAFNNKRPHQLSEEEVNREEKQWGKVKFNPIKKMSCENSTPWSEYKRNLIESQKKEAREKDIQNKNNEALKQKKISEASFRKFTMMGKANEPKEWEKFEEEFLDGVKNKNFDNKILSAEQNLFLKRGITRSVCMDSNLRFRLKDAKYKIGKQQKVAAENPKKKADWKQDRANSSGSKKFQSEDKFNNKKVKFPNKFKKSNKSNFKKANTSGE